MINNKNNILNKYIYNLILFIFFNYYYYIKYLSNKTKLINLHMYKFKFLKFKLFFILYHNYFQIIKNKYLLNHIFNIILI